MIKFYKTLTILLSWITAGNVFANNYCTNFEWAIDFDGIEKAAMIVKISLDGQNFPLQFDTGSDVSGLFDDNAFEFTQQKVTATSGNLTFTHTKIHRLDGKSGQVKGRLGLDALRGKILKIDYPKKAICQIKTSVFEQLFYRLQLAPAQIRSNKLFVFAEVGGSYWPGLFFDTGASIYHLLVDQNHWQRLTGRTGQENNNRYIQGWSKQQLITTVGAPMTSSFTIGSFDVSKPEVHFTEQRPNYFKNYPIDAMGIIGNAPFFDEVIYLDLRKEDAWFGVLKKRTW